MSFYDAVLVEQAPDPPTRPARKRLLVALLCIGALLAGLGVYLAVDPGVPKRLLNVFHNSGVSQSQVFPEIDETQLSADQKKFLAIVRAEFAAQPPGTKYSQGIEEPWCADFVSWVRREMGYPMQNPHGSSWRIPGVYTLQEYLQANTTVHQPGSGYQPKVGDILLYDRGSRFDRHTNFVVAYADGKVTTVGGNEWNEIRVTRFTLSGQPKVLGIAEM